MAVTYIISTFIVICLRQSIEASFNPYTELRCFRRQYNFEVVKNFTIEGVELPCSGIVSANTCYGRCDTNEIADYKSPYMISHHTVCTYGGMRKKIVRLEHCHPSHPDPYYEVFEATFCSCKPCSSDTTSCEGLEG